MLSVGWLVCWLVWHIAQAKASHWGKLLCRAGRHSLTLASMESLLRSIAVLCWSDLWSILFSCGAARWSAPHLFVDQRQRRRGGGSRNGRGQWGMMSMTIHNELQQQHEQHRHYELHSNPQHLAWALISTCPIIDFWSTKELVRFCFGLELHSCQSFGYLVRPEDALHQRLALNWLCKGGKGGKKTYMPKCLNNFTLRFFSCLCIDVWYVGVGSDMILGSIKGPRFYTASLNQSKNG